MKKMNFQQISVRTWVWIALLFGGLTVVSCAPKYGCPINEETHVDFEKSKGKRGKTQLFDKKTTKRIRG
jgi:hypothetical protein